MHPDHRARTVAYIADNLQAADLTLSNGVIQHLNDVSAIKLGFPSDFVWHGWYKWFGDWPTRLDPRVQP